MKHELAAIIVIALEARGIAAPSADALYEQGQVAYDHTSYATAIEKPELSILPNPESLKLRAVEGGRFGVGSQYGEHGRNSSAVAEAGPGAAAGLAAPRPDHNQDGDYRDENASPDADHQQDVTDDSPPCHRRRGHRREAIRSFCRHHARRRHVWCSIVAVRVGAMLLQLPAKERESSKPRHPER
jgi:hypothetical protein